ncbi:MAG: phosphocholine cytidylyltransferase family protein [Nanoarchaeota archaeon]
MKAIILAAGMGTRLGKYTENLPKCMLHFAGKPLIQRQVETLQQAGITDISIVKGYKPDKINIPHVKYYYNEDFAITNMVETLFCAEQELDGKEDLLICYADIIYEPQVLQKIITSPIDIGITVDEDYWDYWQARSNKPEQDMESLIINNGTITELGDTKCTKDQANVRYV